MRDEDPGPAKPVKPVKLARLKKRSMPETLYRSSRLFRVLGSPTSYLIVCALEAGPMTPSELGEALGVPLTTVSASLRHLREIDVVRYEAVGIHKVYWLKDPAILEVLRAAEAWADRMRRLDEFVAAAGGEG